jgi:hypothetical protein
LRFGDLKPAQREAALKLVAAALSRDGYQKITDIMNGDEVLKNAGVGARVDVPARASGSDWTNITARCLERLRHPRRG